MTNAFKLLLKMDRNIKVTNFPKILQARQNYELPGYLQVNEIQDQMLQ